MSVVAEGDHASQELVHMFLGATLSAVVEEIQQASAPLRETVAANGADGVLEIVNQLGLTRKNAAAFTLQPPTVAAFVATPSTLQKSNNLAWNMGAVVWPCIHAVRRVLAFWTGA